jgi:predicted ABC-type transport system involved in lysophospholipase L1 biosynthesis ATPase subunit
VTHDRVLAARADLRLEIDEGRLINEEVAV